ncbi:metallophosphoesterase family protein [Spirochaeta cellobiosiphila]|uniref:metallophosphoesterase family protein n=1 Tax=Spirochaeta cellobiosiphila TaxID=504483 RepID=UPI0003F969F6|nr:metallophosphoesterase family protein [Spirochaeta cellobiosiphila]
MRYLVVSDIHSNYEAFSTVINTTKGSWDKILCLGDITGYGPNPNECIQLLLNYPHIAISGNHDAAITGKLSIDSFNLYAQQAVNINRKLLSSDGKDYLLQLEPVYDDNSATYVHGGLNNPLMEYILTEQSIASNYLNMPHNRLFYGHTHVPVIFAYNNNTLEGTKGTPKIWTLHKTSKYMINPGSVGQPRDRDSRASFGIWDRDNSTWEFKKVQYDIRTTQQKMMRLGCQPHLYERLLKGI